MFRNSTFPYTFIKKLDNIGLKIYNFFLDGFGKDLQAVEQPQRKTTEQISIKESDRVIQSIPTEEIILEREVHPRSELLEVVQAADISPAVENVQTDLLREAAKASKTRKGERRQLVELQAVGEATVRHQQVCFLNIPIGCECTKIYRFHTSG